MTRFLVRRVLRGLLVVWLITLVLFGMFFVAPSNVAQTLGGRQATPQTIALIEQRLGLDRPLWRAVPELRRQRPARRPRLRLLQADPRHDDHR